jgi:hypothetical protein
MLVLKVVTLMTLVSSLFLGSFAQDVASQDHASFWAAVPQGFTLERYTMNTDDESWLTGHAREATGKSCARYDRLVLKYVGAPSELTVAMLEPVEMVQETLGEGTRVMERSDGGMLLVNADQSLVADVDYLWTDVPPYGMMARYELTWCHTAEPSVSR